MLDSNARLRDRLDHITSAGSNQANAHPKLLSELASEIPHSIILAQSLAPDLPIDCYNCFEFALGLAGRNEVRLSSHYIPSTCCNGAFAEYLATSILLPRASEAANGDLVLYRDNQQFTHAGLVHGDRILSKWGTGQLWLHGSLEIPASYGHIFSYYRATNPDEVLAKFLDFARQREGQALVDEVLTFNLRGYSLQEAER